VKALKGNWLKCFYFKDTGSLKVVCSFSQKNKKEETFLKSRFLQISFY